jgi:hypothetical protein
MYTKQKLMDSILEEMMWKKRRKRPKTRKTNTDFITLKVGSFVH